MTLNTVVMLLHIYRSLTMTSWRLLLYYYYNHYLTGDGLNGWIVDESLEENARHAAREVAGPFAWLWFTSQAQETAKLNWWETINKCSKVAEARSKNFVRRRRRCSVDVLSCPVLANRPKDELHFAKTWSARRGTNLHLPNTIKVYVLSLLFMGRTFNSIQEHIVLSG